MIRTSETWRQETRENIRQAAGLAAVSIGVVGATAAPGERLTRDCVNFLLASRAAGATLFGAEGDLVEVVDEPAQ